MSIFIEKIQKNSNICNNCFRRTHITYRRTHRWSMHNQELVLDEIDPDDYPKPRRPTRDAERAILPAEMAARTHKTTTCKCGVFKHTTTCRPLTRSMMITLAQRLVERVEELPDVQLDEDTFFQTLKRLKSDPENQFEDDTLFRRALDKAATNSS